LPRSARATTWLTWVPWWSLDWVCIQLGAMVVTGLGMYTAGAMVVTGLGMYTAGAMVVTGLGMYTAGSHGGHWTG